MLDTDFEHRIYNHQAAHRADEGETLFTTFADRVVRRIHEKLDRWMYTTPASHKEAALLKALLPMIGRDAALSAGPLCERLGVEPRELKQMVQNLRRQASPSVRRATARRAATT